MWPSTARQRLEESCQRPSSGHRRPAASGRVEPTKASDSSPETCRSYLLVDRTWERVGKDRLWPGPGFPGGHPKQTLAGWAVALKVIFLAPRRIHTGGQLRTSDRPEMGPTNDRFESTADMGRRPLAGAHPPTWSLKGLAVVASGDYSCRRNGTHRWTRQDQLGLLDPLRPARAHPCCVALTAGLQRPFAVGQGCIVRPRQALRSRCLSKSRRASNSSG